MRGGAEQRPVALLPKDAHSQPRGVAQPIKQVHIRASIPAEQASDQIIKLNPSQIFLANGLHVE